MMPSEPSIVRRHRGMAVGSVSLVLLCLSCFVVPTDAPLETEQLPTPGDGTTAATTATTDDPTADPTTGAGSSSDDGADSSGGASVCGDGMVQGDEECDDGGQSRACDTDCTTAECGDGVVNDAAGETCDDGMATEACTAECTSVSCGNGMIDDGEECDDGGRSDTCDIDCTMAMCGDGTTNAMAGEACDDGRATANCDADCTAAVCGDGDVNALAGEECDDGGESQGCDADCTMQACGDGTTNATAGETCDDGNMMAGDGCNTACGQTCQLIDGLLWCYDPDICGEACNDVCASAGLTPMADQDAWFQAQNEATECDALAAALGIVGGTTITSYTYGCLETSAGDHVAQPLVGPMLCSTFSGCPMNHLTAMDNSPSDCSDPSARRSICPCE